MLLVCSAIEEEVKDLKEKIRGNFDLEANIMVRALGIGYLEAALNLQKILLDKKNGINRIIFLGTCGLFKKDSLKIKDLINVRSVSLLKLGTQLDYSFSPEKSKSEILYPDQETFSLMMPGTNPAHCVSSLEISKEEKIIDKLLEKNKSLEQVPVVENMELYGIADVANDYQIPWNAILGVSNFIHGSAHREWENHNKEVSSKLCELAFDKISNLF